MSISLGTEIMGLLCLTLISVIFITKNQLYNITAIYFKIIIVFTCFDLVSETLLTLIEMKQWQLPVWILAIICCIRLISAVAILGMLAEYSYVTTFGFNGYTKHKYFIAIGMPALLSAICILFSAFSNNLVGIKQGLFSGIEKFPYYLVLYNYLIYGCIIIFILSVNQGLINRKLNLTLRIITSLEIAILTFIGYKGYLLESLIMPLVLIYLFLIVHYPKEFEDFFSKLFNEQAFLLTIHDKRNWHIAPYVVTISMDHIQEASKREYYLGKEDLMRKLASYMPKNTRNHTSFRIGSRTFALICDKEEEAMEMVHYFESLKEKAKKSQIIPSSAKISVSYWTKTALAELTEPQIVTAIIKTVDFSFENGLDDTLCADPLLDMFVRERQVGKALDKALASNSLKVYFQPIYSVQDKRFTKAEVLVRLIDDEIGFIPPDEFISLAENNGLIFEVEKQVIRKACALFHQYHMEELGIDSININLSLYDLLQKDLKDVIFHAMNENHLSSSNIVLEVTETANIEINKTILANIEMFHNSGMLFALDDYGTGYSNIERILVVPFEYVKIDRTVLNMSFVDQKRDIIFSKNVEMLKKCGYCIVVEGAESEEHIKKLKTLDVDYIQGYYYSKPLPPEEFIEFIKASKQYI